MRPFVPLLALAALSGCKSYPVELHAVVDPARPPLKSETVALAPPANASVQERHLGFSLRDQLCRQGFQLVERGPAKWLIHYGLNRQTQAVGVSTRASAGWWGPNFMTAPVYSKTAMLTLAVTPADPSQADSDSAYWEATAITTDKVWELYEPLVVKAALLHYGQDFNANERAKAADMDDLRNGPGCRLTVRNHD